MNGLQEAKTHTYNTAEKLGSGDEENKSKLLGNIQTDIARSM